MDRKGGVEALPVPAREYQNVAISPAGRRAAVVIDARVWIYDFARASLTPLHTGSGVGEAPIWTPDGTRVVYRGTLRNLFWKAVDSTSEEERLRAR